MFCLSAKHNRTNLVDWVRLARFSSVIERTSSINRSHRKVPVIRLCSITEPEQQSGRLGSIDFDWFLVRFRSIDYAGSNIQHKRQTQNYDDNENVKKTWFYKEITPLQVIELSICALGGRGDSAYERSCWNADHADCWLRTADWAVRADCADWVFFFFYLYLNSLVKFLLYYPEGASTMEEGKLFLSVTIIWIFLVEEAFSG